MFYDFLAGVLPSLLQDGYGTRREGICELCEGLQRAPLQVHFSITGKVGCRDRIACTGSLACHMFLMACRISPWAIWRRHLHC